jgi:monofunctional glycosyltransferase
MRKSRFRRILWLFLKCFLALLLASIALVVVFRLVSPPFSALMIERRAAASWSGKKYSAQYEWVPFDRIAPAAGLAVIASEDQNFPRHHGFDWQAIQKALDHNEESNRTRGASTLTQQTAKNLFLWPGRNWLRKGVEAYFTVLMEGLWSKRRILETYLNIVEFGDGIYGVEAAAQQFFHKPASRLTPEEAALLAAALPDPHRLKPYAPSAYLRERQQWILQQMDQLGGANFIKTIP